MNLFFSFLKLGLGGEGIIMDHDRYEFSLFFLFFFG